MNYVSGTVLKDLGKVPCIYFGDRTQEKRIWKFNFPNPFLPTYGFKLQTNYAPSSASISLLCSPCMDRIGKVPSFFA